MLYKTTEITIAAYLRLNNVPLTRIDMNHNQGTFVFDNVDDNLINQYVLGSALVEPGAFHNMVRQLTTAVRQQSNFNKGC